MAFALTTVERGLYGTDAKLAHFGHHSDTLTRLNHGSYGGSPRAVIEAQQDLRIEYLQVRFHVVVMCVCE